MNGTSPIEIVKAWQDAASHRDIARLLELSEPNIEVVGPRGSGRGQQLLQEWLQRSGLTFTTLGMYARGNTVVVEQHGIWHSPETGEPTGEADFASQFQLNGGRVSLVARYDSLQVALNKAGLDFTNEVPPGC